jgi:hypothetical protein
MGTCLPEFEPQDGPKPGGRGAGQAPIGYPGLPGSQAPEAVFATAIEVPAEGRGGGVQPSPIGPRALNPMTTYAPVNQLAPATPVGGLGGTPRS